MEEVGKDKVVAEETYQKAEKFYESGRYDEAENMYTQFIDTVYSEVQKSNAETGHPVPVHHRNGIVDSRYQTLLTHALNNRGQIKYLRVDFDEAIEDYSAALKVNQNFAISYYNRGQIHYRLGRYTNGIEDFQKALALQPDFCDAKLALKTAIEEQCTSNTRETYQN